jgi:hypothetical protein
MSAAMDLVFADQRHVSSRWNAEVQIDPPSVTTSATPAVPAWTSAVVRRLNDLLRLGENWDSYGASKPSGNSAVELVKVLYDVAGPDTPPPAIVPSPAGHFQAEWHRNGIDLELEVVTPTKILVSFSSAQGSWDAEMNLDITRLAEAVRQVGRP